MRCQLHRGQIAETLQISKFTERNKKSFYGIKMDAKFDGAIDFKINLIKIKKKLKTYIFFKLVELSSDIDVFLIQKV